MKNKLAKLKFLPNNFEVIENLNYWNVEDQEPYFSYKEASIKKDKT